MKTMKSDFSQSTFTKYHSLLNVLHVCVLSRFSRVQLFETLWTAAHQAPLSMGFPRQEYWGGFPCPLPGHLLNPGIEPVSFKCPTLASRFFTSSTTWEAYVSNSKH